MSDEVKKPGWWTSLIAAFGIGGGSGSITTFYMIEKVEAKQEELQQRVINALYEINGRLIAIETEMKLKR